MRIFGSALLLILLAFPGAAMGQTAPFDDTSLGTFREMLEHVLETNPEIVKTAMLRAEAVESARQEARTKQAAADLMRTAGSAASSLPTVGPKEAEVTILQVIDYRCPYCRLMHAQTTRLIRGRPDVRVAFVITSILGEESETLARFALAADEQGKFGAVHDLLSSGDVAPAGEAGLAVLAKRAGVNWPRARAAMTSPSTGERLQSMQRAWLLLQQPGTPLTVVGETMFAGVTDAAEIGRSLPQRE